MAQIRVVHNFGKAAEAKTWRKIKQAEPPDFGIKSWRLGLRKTRLDRKSLKFYLGDKKPANRSPQGYIATSAGVLRRAANSSWKGKLPGS